MMSNDLEHAISESLVLAAVDRAERHRTGERTGVPIWLVLEHLEIPKRSSRARVVRGRLETLGDVNALARSRRHGVPVWSLTSTGRRRLGRARRAGKLGELPESPQHRAWREARVAATQRIPGFRGQLRAALDEAGLLLAAPGVPSDAWFEFGERLARCARRLGSATHCLYEWPEPDDVHADIDDHSASTDAELDPQARDHARALRVGRRNMALWDDRNLREPPSS
jgi:hypothetical protein